MRRATTRDGLVIAYDDAGSSDTALLCMPGWCIERSVFAPLVGRAGPRRRVLALDWRGHGDSPKPAGDFGGAELLDDALAVIEASGASRVMPVAQAHASWIALELARRLGERVPAIVATSSMMFAPPPPFAGMLAGLQDAERFAATRDRLVGMWLEGGPNDVVTTIKGMTERYGLEMWSRGAREIASSFASHETFTSAASRLSPVRPVLHLFAQPRAPEYLAAHEAFARDHAWFRFKRLDGATHFPTLEAPDAVLEAIDAFAR
jgi:pimeloyl-ACP methyl ester carboxylesterase